METLTREQDGDISVHGSMVFDQEFKLPQYDQSISEGYQNVWNKSQPDATACTKEEIGFEKLIQSEDSPALRAISVKRKLEAMFQRRSLHFAYKYSPGFKQITCSGTCQEDQIQLLSSGMFDGYH